MKVSELIEQLQSIPEHYGDLSVRCSNRHLGILFHPDTVEIVTNTKTKKTELSLEQY